MRGVWTRVTQQPQSRPRPGEVLLVGAADGGYDSETGLDLSAHGPVPDSPELLTPEELAERAAQSAIAEAAQAAGQAEFADVVAGTEDAYAADTASVVTRRWQSLDEHSSQVRDQAAALLAAMRRPASRWRPPAAPSSRATCTMSARRTRSGRTRSAPWPRTRRRPRSPPAAPGPSQEARAVVSTSQGTSRSATSSRHCCSSTARCPLC